MCDLTPESEEGRTIQGVAEKLGLAEEAIWEMIHNGVLPRPPVGESEAGVVAFFTDDYLKEAISRIAGNHLSSRGLYEAFLEIVLRHILDRELAGEEHLPSSPARGFGQRFFVPGGPNSEYGINQTDDYEIPSILRKQMDEDPGEASEEGRTLGTGAKLKPE